MSLRFSNRVLFNMNIKISPIHTKKLRMCDSSLTVETHNEPERVLTRMVYYPQYRLHSIGQKFVSVFIARLDNVFLFHLNINPKKHVLESKVENSTGSGPCREF